MTYKMIRNFQIFGSFCFKENVIYRNNIQKQREEIVYE